MHAQVVASYGHIRDLVQRAGAVLPERDFEMQWSMGVRSAVPMRAITEAVKGAERLVLATDPDREGEAISWHLAEVLKVGWELGKYPATTVGPFQHCTDASFSFC